MTKQASDIVRKIELLPESEQVVLADYLARHLEDVLDEARWAQLFDRGPSALDALAAEVDQAIASGDFAPLDPDEL